MINWFGYKTSCRPIRSARSADFVITWACMITDRIGLHLVLLPLFSVPVKIPFPLCDVHSTVLFTVHQLLMFPIALLNSKLFSNLHENTNMLF